MDELQVNQSVESSSVAAQQKLTVEDLMILMHDLVYILAAVALTFMFFFRIERQL